MRIFKNIVLAPYTTFKIGGPAAYFVSAKSAEDIVKAISFAAKKNIPYFLLGGGSNVLVSDDGFHGLVIRNRIDNLDVENDLIRAGAGALMNRFVSFSVGRGLAGLEWAAGLPGTVGGAIRGNAGCFGSDISKHLESVEVLENGSVSTFDIKKCGFSYRNSIFKKDKNKIIISAYFRLQKCDNKAKSEQFINSCLERRQEHPSEPSAGCVFENPKPLVAAKLVEQCGLKGKKIGGAQISPKHANFIVNTGNAKAKDVLALISLIKKTVKNKLDIRIKEEIQYVGF